MLVTALMSYSAIGQFMIIKVQFSDPPSRTNMLIHLLVADWLGGPWNSANFLIEVNFY